MDFSFFLFVFKLLAVGHVQGTLCWFRFFFGRPKSEEPRQQIVNRKTMERKMGVRKKNKDSGLLV